MHFPTETMLCVVVWSPNSPQKPAEANVSRMKCYPNSTLDLACLYGEQTWSFNLRLIEHI
jgi:hypothetical protein